MKARPRIAPGKGHSLGQAWYTLRWLALVALPALLLFGALALVDPFDRFGTRLVDERVKRRQLHMDPATMPFANALWKIIAFRRDPCPRIVLGDSRLTRFNVARLDSLTGEEHFNFGVPGGNCHTLFDLFWYADSLVELEDVTLQMAFRTTSDHADWDITSAPLHVAGSPWRYLTDRTVQLTGLRCLLDGNGGTRQAMQGEQPRRENWNMVLDRDRDLYRKWLWPERLLPALDSIVGYCSRQGITLRIVEMPSHVDEQELVEEAGLTGERERYRQEMRRRAPYFDLDHPGPLTTDRELYIDPLHSRRGVMDRVIDQVWGGGRAAEQVR